MANENRIEFVVAVLTLVRVRKPWSNPEILNSEASSRTAFGVTEPEMPLFRFSNSSVIHAVYRSGMKHNNTFCYVVLCYA